MATASGREADQDVGLVPHRARRQRRFPSAMAPSRIAHSRWQPAFLSSGAKPFERRLILASQRAETGQRVRYEGRAGVVGDTVAD